MVGMTWASQQILISISGFLVQVCWHHAILKCQGYIKEGDWNLRGAGASLRNILFLNWCIGHCKLYCSFFGLFLQWTYVDSWWCQLYCKCIKKCCMYDCLFLRSVLKKCLIDENNKKTALFFRLYIQKKYILSYNLVK